MTMHDKIEIVKEENKNICTFFGHRDVGMVIFDKIKQEIENLIINNQVTEFLIGNNGGFDLICKRAILELKEKHDNINLILVLAYMPNEKTVIDNKFDSSIYPEGLESVPRKFAIVHRNRWMVSQSDFVICSINRSYGGAYTAFNYAKTKKKIVINIVD